MEVFLEPKFLIGLSFVIGLLYLFFSLKIDKNVNESNENAIRIHSNTYNATRGLFDLVEKEMRVRVANQVALEKSETIIRLEAQIKELEERKQDLLEQISELEKGELYNLVEEIKLIRAKLDNFFFHIGSKLNPVMKWIERGNDGDLEKAHKHYNQVKQEEETNLREIDKSIKQITKRLKI